MKLKLFSMVLIPIILFGQAHKVPLGTRGNKLVYTVTNKTFHTMYKLGVFVESFPDWIQFDHNTFMIDSLKTGTSCEAEFWFDAKSGKSGETGKVIIGLMDNNRKIISKKALTICAVLQSNESKLYPPYPNPANPSTMVRFSLKEQAEVKIMVFNILGQEVKTLVDKPFSAGLWEIPWQGKNSYGQQVASGMYIIKLKATGETRTQEWSVKVNVQH